MGKRSSKDNTKPEASKDKTKWGFSNSIDKKSKSRSPEKDKHKWRFSKSPEKNLKYQSTEASKDKSQCSPSSSAEKNLQDQSPEASKDNIKWSLSNSKKSSPEPSNDRNTCCPSVSPEKNSKTPSPEPFNDKNKCILSNSPEKILSTTKEEKTESKKGAKKRVSSPDKNAKTADGESKFKKMIRSIKDADVKKPCKVHGYSSPTKKRSYHRNLSELKDKATHTTFEDKIKSETLALSALGDAKQNNNQPGTLMQNDGKPSTYMIKKSILKSNGDISKLSKMRSNIKFDFLPSTWQNSASWLSVSQDPSTTATNLWKVRDAKSNQSQSKMYSGSFQSDRRRSSSPGYMLTLDPEVQRSKMRVSPFSQAVLGQATSNNQRRSKSSILSRFNQITENPELLNPTSIAYNRSVLSLLQKPIVSNSFDMDIAEKLSEKICAIRAGFDGAQHRSSHPYTFPSNVCQMEKPAQLHLMALPSSGFHSHPTPTSRTGLTSATSIRTESIGSDLDAISVLSSQSDTTEVVKSPKQQRRISTGSRPDSDFKSLPLRQLSRTDSRPDSNFKSSPLRQLSRTDSRPDSSFKSSAERQLRQLSEQRQLQNSSIKFSPVRQSQSSNFKSSPLRQTQSSNFKPSLLRQSQSTNFKSSPMRQLNQQHSQSNLSSSSCSSASDSSCSSCSGMFTTNVPSRMSCLGNSDSHISNFYGPKYRVSLRNPVCNRA